MENLNTNVINGLIVIAGGITLLFGVGGVAAVIAFFRTRAKDLERAYQSTDPATQAHILDVVNVLKGALTVANTVIANLAAVIQLGVDITDGDPNTPADPTDPASLLAQASRLEAKAKIIRTTALNVSAATTPPEQS